ncbi:MAG: hypothetical protein HYZ16_09605 [Bacteroidetes bacterium]|jgi:hypothetical protein|nr:hypothetical protein [Bacteroidota bacterium]
MKYLLTLLLTFLFISNGNAQPAPFRGTLLFNLTEKGDFGEFLTAEAFKSGKVLLLSSDKESELTYDTLHKAFSYTTIGFEKKQFAIIYNNDTIYIDYPSLPFIKAVFVKAPIPLNGVSFSFSNKYTYDAMHSNQYYNNFRMFYLCQGCFISDNYAMTEETKKHIRKELFTHTIKFKE